ncbi:MAG TPA: serine/threonine-protein kinase [Terriglobales bacterium]|nr:serine/threonine-protein kinase [Terriglobales bacterium]
MAKKKFAWADVALGAVVSLLILLTFWMQWADGIEGKLYDMRAKLRARAKGAENVVLIGIDDDSIREIGRWPWPRSYMADMVDQLSEAQAKVVGLDIFFSDAELNPGLEQIKSIKAAIDQKYSDPRHPNPTAAEISGVLEQAAQNLDNDAKLENSLALAQNAVLPMFFHEGRPIGKVDKAIPAAVDKNFIANVKLAPSAAEGSGVTSADDFTPPYQRFADVAKAVGEANLTPSSDGVQREVPLVMDFNGRLMPSFALQCLRAYYNLESDDYRFTPGKELVLGRAHVPVDPQGRMLVDYGNLQNMTVVKFSDVRNKKIPTDAFRDKIVIIGMYATGGGDQYTSPVGNLFPGMAIHASVIQNVLNNSYLIRPQWAPKAELALLVLFALFVSLAIPHMKAGMSAIIAVVLLAVVIAGGIYGFTAYGYWLKMIYPVLMLVVGYTVVVSKRYLVTEKRKETLEGESVETNKMLGLSFQGQGMLDMAFEKFRKCPVDDSMKDVLYGLALDFERKRQFNKAVQVFEHIMTVDKKFKDVEARAQKLRVAGETVIFGGRAGMKAGADSTVLVQGGGVSELAKPTLGRYEVMKELGKGAMGVVYLGKDPKINREVAIKTLRFEDEFEAADMKAMKERFFREAESAGRLVHPNIVTIYDAGDDGDISYIAMELLSGSDLKDYTTKDKLLPTGEALETIAKVADALDYAHTQGVVHRDIKPANIMRLKDGAIKVTDFGIARITSQSKTATGTVMGTPSYMSPEQLAGARVDGRADLFSLGVTLYELLTGEKPFTGDTVATLMFKIANAPHPQIRASRADLPAGVEAIIDKALQKDPEKRYQRGAEMAKDLRALTAKAAGAGA